MDLVADHESVVLGHDLGEPFELLAGMYEPHGVVGIAQQHAAGTRAQGGVDAAQIKTVARGVVEQRDLHDPPAGLDHEVEERRVDGRGDDHAVAGRHETAQRLHDHHAHVRGVGDPRRVRAPPPPLRGEVRERLRGAAVGRGGVPGVAVLDRIL